MSKILETAAPYRDRSSLPSHLLQSLPGRPNKHYRFLPQSPNAIPEITDRPPLIRSSHRAQASKQNPFPASPKHRPDPSFGQSADSDEPPGGKSALSESLPSPTDARLPPKRDPPSHGTTLSTYF